ncbi:hypothetical protein [Paraburkholderia phenazinium]|uniref:Uncharacterized protein n=1 Tax=Paraburkholderia phenazinium TaxID=60549 RepID=A0A1G8IYU8_9BURK|nr:hypothetical protein [Paraburkholderia phenazinium]SDI23897.1 hypothetical protein SAMN05216466_11963 [Paraburkholderia phenazinium]
MNAWQKKSEKANIEYERTLTVLKEAREAYETGAGKNLAETTANAQRLRELIVQQKDAAEAAQAALGVALRSSNAAVTQASKDALSARRSAEDMADAYQAMLDETVTAQIEATLAADDAASRYEGAWQLANTAQVSQIAYAALAECGEVIARAMAAGGREIIERELQHWKPDGSDDAAQARREALGHFSLGALHDGDRLGTAARCQIVEPVLRGERDGLSLLRDLCSRHYLSAAFADALRALYARHASS